MRPNIVIFNPDQMRADALSHLGNPASETRFLDAFCKNEAVSFRNAFCQNPVCVPSRCSFLTGLYPHVHGHRTMSYMLRGGEPTVLQELKDSGYDVWMNGRNDFLAAQEKGLFELHANEIFYGGDVPDAPGTVDENPRGSKESKNFYSFYQGELKTDDNGKNYTIDDESVDAAIRFVNEHGEKSEQPFCMFLALQLPHPPYQIEQPYFSSIDRKKLAERIKISDEELGRKAKILGLIRKEQHLDELTETDWDEVRACYLAMCEKVDVLFEKLCNALKDAGCYDNTAIFFFSDHGDYTGDYGISEKTQNTFEDCLVNVPCLVKPPKDVAVSPGISDSMVELVDIYPTIMEWCDLAPRHSHFGKSLTPLLSRREAENRAFVCCEGGRLKSEMHCNETGDRTPHPFDPYYPRKMAQKDDIAHTKATMIRTKDYKYIKRLYESDEFYDLKNDPKEKNNEIDNPSYQERIAEMKSLLLEWYQETCDVVPFEWDQRFNGEMIWHRVKSLVPDERVEEIKNEIKNGAELFMLQERLRRERKS